METQSRDLGNPTIGDETLVDDITYVEFLNQLRRDYRLVTESVDIAGHTYRFSKIANPNEMEVDLNSDGSLKWQPYWAEDWKSSRSLCWLLASEPLQGLQVMDLGCGLGLTSAVAAHRGASVVCGDHALPALRFCELNCWKWREHCRFAQIDWRSDSQDWGRFDLIVGAEIIYDKEDWSYLTAFWKRHLSLEGAIWLCDPYRATGKEFRVWIQSQGWSCQFFDKRIEGMEGEINVIELRHPAATHR